MAISTEEQRKQNEIEQGRMIASHAEAVWQRHTRAGQLRLDVRFDDLKRTFGQQVNGRILELGCGTGLWSEYLSGICADVTSMDISEDLINVARSKPVLSRVQFVRGDCEHMPFPDRSFENVCGLSVLHHLNVPQTLKEILRVIKPGGKLWFSEPNMMNPQIMVQKNVPIIKRWLGDTPDETAFFRWPLEKTLLSFGLKHVEVIPFDFLHPQTPNALVPAIKWFGEHCERIPVLKEIAGSLMIHAQA